MKKTIISLLILFAALSALYSNDASSYVDDILVSDIPITYGDESFRARILEKTGGEREPVGLVLTGGSARAAAHIGVLKYLEEEGIVPDFIISNSMGSIIGMLYAAGMKPSQIEEFFLAGDISTFFDITLPIRGGLVVPSGFKTIVNTLVGADYRLEDTEIPIMVVADDLVTKREIRIAEGNFSDILIASFALPVYFDPQIYKGHLIVDGGIVSLAPIDAAYEYSNSIILSTAFYDVPEMNLINPITILNASFDIGKRQRAALDMKKHPDLIWIRCDVENYSFMAFDKAIEMAAIGYESAKKKEAELADVYRAGQISDRLAQLRNDVQPRIEKINSSLYYFNRVEAERPTTLLGFGFGSMQDPLAPYYLDNSTFFNLNYGYINKSVETSAGIGVGFDTYDLSNSQTYVTAGGKVSYYPMVNMKIGSEFYTNIGQKNAGFHPSIYFRETLDYIPVSYKEIYRLALHQNLEYYKDYGGQKGTANLFSLGMDGKYGFDWGYLWTRDNYMLIGTSIIFEEPKNYMQISLGARGYLNKSHSLYFDGSLFSRFSLDGKGSVPLFFSDGYSSTIINYGANATVSNTKRHNTILGIAAGYKLNNNPTFGEFLIFEKSELGLYFDLLLQDSSVGISTGVDIQSVASLIGLLKLPMRFKIGYEYTPSGDSAFVSSLIFAVKY